MKKVKFYFILLIVAVGLLTGRFFLTIFSTASSAPNTVIFSVKSGEGVKEISSRLAKQGLIKSDYWFRVYVWTRGWEKRFQAGEHELNSGMNILAVTRALISGSAFSSEKQITVIEGWNNRELGQFLEEQGIGDKKEFLRLVARTGWQSKYEFFDDKPLDVDIEGYLFPDTYRIYKDSTQEDVVNKMLANFDNKLTEQMRQDIKKRGITIHEALTLASIVEKEVKGNQDRKKVADIFYKRLKAGIGLQADSTVNYVTGKNVTGASLDDLKKDSPYNTYKYRGLPPGPISNPGMSSILAVIYPEANPYYYFLTAKDGQVYYGKTFEEHVKNRVHL